MWGMICDATRVENVAWAAIVSAGRQYLLRGYSVVYQFVRVCEGVLVGGVCRLADDVIPSVVSNRRLDGLNLVGMRRSGVSRGYLLARRVKSRFIGVSKLVRPPVR